MPTWALVLIAVVVLLVARAVLQRGERMPTGQRPGDRALGPRANMPDPEVEAAIADLLRRGRKIDAIKLHRQAYWTGLKEAREAVEQLERTLPQP
jgi:ribosomal protein L7/L12